MGRDRRASHRPNLRQVSKGRRLRHPPFDPRRSRASGDGESRRNRSQRRHDLQRHRPSARSRHLCASARTLFAGREDSSADDGFAQDDAAAGAAAGEAHPGHARQRENPGWRRRRYSSVRSRPRDRPRDVYRSGATIGRIRRCAGPGTAGYSRRPTSDRYISRPWSSRSAPTGRTSSERKPR